MTSIPDAAIAVIAAARCAGCRRRLKHPTPSGFGPVCAKKLPERAPDGRTGPEGPRVRSALSQRLTARPTPREPHPGQTQLPLEET